MFVHSYVSISMYLFLELICEISETLNLDKPLFLLLMVISSDIGGYIIGKLFGNIKIFPNISPNKTIEGTVGSIFFTLIIWIIFFKGFASIFIIKLTSLTRMFKPECRIFFLTKRRYQQFYRERHKPFRTVSKSKSNPWHFFIRELQRLKPV